MVKLIFKHKNLNHEFSIDYIFNGIFSILQNNNLDISFTREIIHEFPHWNGTPRHGSLVIENPLNKKTIVLSYDDCPLNILNTIEGTGWIPANIQELYCVSNVQEIKNNKKLYQERYNINISQILKPFNYIVYRSEFDTKYCDIIYNSKLSSKFRKQQLIFKGLLYRDREYCSKNCKHKEICITNQNLKNLPEYAHELTESRCNLSFNGMAEICMRDMEIMALGMPMIRQKLKSTEFLDPLIPGYHYIDIDEESDELKMNAIINKWEEIKHNYDLLDFIGENARKWYIKNAKLDNQILSFVNLVNLTLLY